MKRGLFWSVSMTTAPSGRHAIWEFYFWKNVSTWLVLWHAVNWKLESSLICVRFFAEQEARNRLRESFSSSHESFFQLQHQTDTRHFYDPYLFTTLKIQLRKGWNCHHFHAFLLFFIAFLSSGVEKCFIREPIERFHVPTKKNDFVTPAYMSWQL